MSTMPSMSQALTIKRPKFLPILLVLLGVLVAVGAALYGYVESRRSERVVVAARPIPAGTRIGPDDLTTVEVPLNRPAQLAGVTDSTALLGQYATRDVGSADLLKPEMVTRTAPDQVIYPNGQKLTSDMVPLAFSVANIGPMSERDLVNLLYLDPSGDPALCQQAIAAASGQTPDVELRPKGTDVTRARPYACRFLSRVRVLYLDKGVAYLELTPYQALAVNALQAAGVQLKGEAYGRASATLPALDRLDASQIVPATLLAPVPTAAPASSTTLPGAGPVPGELPSATPQP